MYNLIEYLMIFIVVTIFCPNNYWSIIYIIGNVVALGVFLFSYLKHHKNSKIEKQQISKSLFLTLIMIIAINIVMKMEIVNLVFGIAFVVYFCIVTIKSIIKKDYVFNKRLISSTRVFDIYTLFYLVGIIIMILQYEV